MSSSTSSTFQLPNVPNTQALIYKHFRHCIIAPNNITEEAEEKEKKSESRMKPIDDKQEKVTIRAVSRDEEGRKRVEKTELTTHNVDTIKYVEKKLINKGIQRQDRHPADGIAIGRPPTKSGHGGKFTWEGPADVAENELMDAPAAIDEGDPNYEDGEEKEDEVAELVVGEVEVAKVGEERDGVARVDIDPRLKVN